jgi:hypothetical protein
MKNLIGTSLSMCIRDILEKKVDINNISGIISSTAFKTPKDAFDSYYKIYWSKPNPKDVMETLEKVWPLLCQPRLNFDLAEHRGHFSVKGHWLNTETGVFSTNP